MMINTLMWSATDELDEANTSASIRTSSYENAGLIAKRLRRLNLKRAELVDELSGIDEAMEEAAEEKL